ncbi:MAG: heparinase II/III-family protein [Planctomycetota bacterium]|nr:heparinase II/III-family protein [Planctomycetota bacterium]
MSLFLSASERAALLESRETVVCDYRWALNRRAARRAHNPGLLAPGTTTEWWYVAAEYVADAAMAQALTPDAAIAAWLRGAVMDLARRGEDDWAGPWFRDHGGEPKTGHLETAHLSWALSLALDLAADVFTAGERSELHAVLRERAMPMCQRWIDRHRQLANWRCILLAGVTLPAALLDERQTLERCAAEWSRCVEAFQDDGSYGESLQYSHYAMYGLMLAFEAIVRRDPQLAAGLDVTRYGRGMRWHAASQLYRKPLGGAWGGHPRPRAVNFNDSGALFAPSPELLLHVALRCAERLPEEAALARWLCDACWSPFPDLGPHDRATFGLLPTWTGLTLPFLGHLGELPPARSPADLGLERVQHFACGDTIARDAWDGRTVLAVRGGGELLAGHGHLHADLNHFVLVHNRERLLADPGHSCYRNLLHRIETGTAAHSTCTFQAGAGPDARAPEDAAQHRFLEQHSRAPQRLLIDGVPGERVDRGARHLLAACRGSVAAIGSEAAALYGAPLERFARFWLLAGSHVVFVVDHIVASSAVKTTWNWVLNNRAGELDCKPLGDRLVVRRGAAGMKLFHLAGATTPDFAHGWLHEAYHPQPGQLGEGANGSALLARWSEPRAQRERWAVHAIALDGPGAIAGWHLREEAGYAAVLEGPGGGERWALRLDPERAEIHLAEQAGGRRWSLRGTETGYGLEALT